MSTLVMALVAGMAVGSDLERVSAEQIEVFDLSGDWVCDQKDGGCVISYGPEKGSIFMLVFGIKDEGGGIVRLNEMIPTRLGIYERRGDRLIICYRPAWDGPPTSFSTAGGQGLLVFRRVRPAK
jgi:hypothetical protein